MVTTCAKDTTNDYKEMVGGGGVPTGHLETGTVT